MRAHPHVSLNLPPGGGRAVVPMRMHTTRVYDVGFLDWVAVKDVSFSYYAIYTKYSNLN